jgi:Na+/melibiose symporter-like transporter
MKRLRWFDHLWINIFWLAINVRNNAVGSLFLPYLVDVFARQEVKNTALGGLRTAGLIIAMLAQPAIGLLSDRSTSRFGRRRPFFLVGILLDLVFLAMMYFAWNYASLVVILMLFQVTMNTSHGPLQALIPDLVPEDQRGISSAMKAIFELLPLILVGFTIAGLVGAGHLDWAFVATGVLMVIILIPSLLFVKEEPLREKPDLPFWPPMLRVLGMLAGILGGALAGVIAGAVVGGLLGLIIYLIAGANGGKLIGVSLGGLVAMCIAVVIGVWAGVRVTLGSSGSSFLTFWKASSSARNEKDTFSWWVINRLFFLAAITSLQGFAPYFLMYALQVDRNQATSLTGSLMTMVGIFTLITALPGGWFSDRFGHKRVIAISGIAAAAGSFILLGTIWLPRIELIYFAGAILGLATGLFVTANWALGTALVPAAEAGRYMGVSNLAGAGAGMIGSGMGGPVADYLNAIIPGVGYFVLFACYGIMFLLSTASLRRIRTVNVVDLQPAEAGQVAS